MSNTPQDMMFRDLDESGLTPVDISARVAGSAELMAIGIPTSTPGYVIPYYDAYGKMRPFYRVKLFNQPIKYKQPKATANHIYFPKHLQRDLTKKGYVIIVEGEKKAACAVKNGFPAVGLGGVDSWKNRTIMIPKGADLGKSYGKSGDIAVKLPSGSGDLQESGYTILATGFQDLIDVIMKNQLHVLIAFDSDHQYGLKFEVQRAAAALAFELRYRGINFDRIHQLILPPIQTIDSEGTEEFKTGLDDFIVDEENGGVEQFEQLVNNAVEHGTFPRHPNVREFVNKKLQRAKMGRKETQAVSMAILSDLDATGRRLRSNSTGNMYYFDYSKRRLLDAQINHQNKGFLHGTPFGQLLYLRYGLSAADQRILTWLDVQFNSEFPIADVTPHRVIAKPKPGENIVRYQISDSQYVKVSADKEEPVEILDNGTEGYLFEADHVEPIEGHELLKALEDIRSKPVEPWWLDIINNSRMKHGREDRILISTLFYISPWLHKWKKSQLPIEIILGEPGSGKSSLYEHRLNILTGQPKLRNAPKDLKDWHASISNSGGLHAIDNVQLANKSLRQSLSDEYCRLVTESDPHIEQRKLYSNNELIRIPVSTVFAITAIKQPFTNADVIQRSILIELDKAGSSLDGSPIRFSSTWVEDQMNAKGGRAMWIAHHLHILHKFFTLVEEKWNNNYMASYRLINIEQALMLMGEVLGHDMSFLPEYLAKTNAKNISEADWALECLLAFSKEKCRHGKQGVSIKWSAGDIAGWAELQEDFEDNQLVTNSRKLGRHIQTHKSLVTQISGLYENGKKNNKVMYSIRKDFKP